MIPKQEEEYQERVDSICDAYQESSYGDREKERKKLNVQYRLAFHLFFQLLMPSRK